MPKQLRRLASWLERTRYKLAGRLMTQQDVVAVMFSRQTVEKTKDFVGPLELRFRALESGVYVMDLRDGKAKAYEMSVAQRAQRQ